MLGNPGSGKTARAVRMMKHEFRDIPIYSNIETKGIKHNTLMSGSMIVEKVPVIITKDGIEQQKIKRDGTPVTKKQLNADFWEKAPKPCVVLIDEAHSMINARKAMSKVNEIVTDWLALIRRVIGGKDGTYGELILISQLDRRIDVIAREMSTLVEYHRCHYFVECKRCHNQYAEHNDIPEKMRECACGYRYFKRHSFTIEVWSFRNVNDYIYFIEMGRKTYFKRQYISDIENYFKHYNTFQWKSLMSESITIP